MAVGLLVVVLLGIAVVVLAMATQFGPVKRERLERFAERGALPITRDNGNLVIRYLGLTRRWRALGLITGLAISIAWSLREGRVNVDLLLGFGGWFIGAVIAEYEFTVVQPGEQRAASLQPRLLRDRLSLSARLAPLAIVALALGIAALLLVTRILHGEVALGPIAGWVALTAAAIAVPVLVGRHVLNRAQPLNLTGDVRDADNALRHRSLHVLAGSALALACYPAGGLAAMAADRLAEAGPGRGPSSVSVAFLVLAVVLVFMPLAGLLIARTRRIPDPAELFPAA